jgi:serine/threonine-protein kinase
MEFIAGTVVAGKYRCERVIGEGGIGLVIAATHLELGELVALKFLREKVSLEPEVAERFVREAKTAVRLKSEHVARVHDSARLETGEPYIVLEYLEGTDLSALIRERGKLAPEEACAYVLQASEALAEAHALGMVHRDIKPGNLFLAKGPAGVPVVKVLDFGITKANPLGDQDDQNVTKSSTLLGSPKYMSPEQMRSSHNVDARSDIWSLGVVLYALLAGSVPFKGDTLGDVFHLVMNEPAPPLSEIRPDIPAELAAAVMKCLEKDRAARYQNLAELAADLVPFAGASGLVSAHKIRMYLSAPSAAASSGSLPAVQVVREVSRTSGTMSAVTTNEPVAPRKRWPLVVAVIVAGAASGTLLVLKPWAKADAPPVAASASATAPPTTQTASAAPPPTTSAEPAPPPSATIATTATARVRGHHPQGPKPQVAASSESPKDAIPSTRE